jgi:hypothetical protein
MSVVQSCNMGGYNPIKSLRNPLQQWGFNLRFVSKFRHIEPMLEWKLSCSAWQSKIKVRLEIQPLDSISDQKAPSITEGGGKRLKVHHTQGETSDMSLKKVGISFWTHNNCIIYKCRSNNLIQRSASSWSATFLWLKSLQQGLIDEFSTLSNSFLWKETIFSRNGSLGLFYFKSNFQTHHY